MDVSRGGRETSTAQIAAELARQGADVTILCQAGSLGGSPVQLMELGARGRSRWKRMRNFIAAVADCARTGRFDVLHTMLPVPHAGIYQPRGGTVPAQLAASLRRRQGASRLAAAITHPFNFCRRGLGRLEKRIATDPRTTCLCVSQMVAREFQGYYGRRDGVSVVYNAVDMPDADDPRRSQWRSELRARLNVAQDDPVFLSIATNFALKGVAQTIAAFALWRSTNGRRCDRQLIERSRLVVVGGRRYADRYHRLAQEHGLGQHVVFVPPTRDVLPWYAAADACILLSWYDPCSRVVLEATRWGIPSITTLFNGASEILCNGAGLVVDSPDSTAAVAAAMDQLAQPAVRNRFSQSCLKAAPMLSIDRHVQQLLEAYKRQTVR